MKYTGNIRKMRSSLDEEVQYQLPLYNVLEPEHFIPMNALIGKELEMDFEHEIHCVVTGKKIKKPYGEGMSFDAFMQSPQASPSIIRPELSRIHEGVALRDFEWEMEHHMQPHVTYLSLTSGVKVGVTRLTQIPTRWIDQGATQALIIAEVPYRQLAGLIEVALKDHFADKTNWRDMLKNSAEDADLQDAKSHIYSYLPADLQQYLVDDEEVLDIHYPVIQYPQKVKSIKLDKVPSIKQKLMGIKGQYLIFENGEVLNIRSHAGYKVSLEI
jgi:hypothetical protein